jgi:iron complex outermembrane recepter protein
MSHAKNERSRNTMVAAAIIAALSGAHAATAQEEAGIGEIVITAQKREQRLQDVPIAVSVVTGALAESVGGFNAEGLKQLVPSLNIRKTNTSLNQSLFLRGVGTINFAIAAQPSVAFVLDGVVLSSAGEAFGDLYDIERVEVLRGPQGTLFGKNSSAGVVNVVTRRPAREFGGYVDASWFEDDEKRVKAAIDIPISDALRTRTTLMWGEFDGYIDNVTTTAARGKLNGYERKGIRTVLEADPTDNVRLTFSADWRESDDNCCVEVIGRAPTGGQAAALTQLLAGTEFLGDRSRKVRQNLQMRSQEEAWGLGLQADISLPGDLSLTSITAFRTWDATEIREGDWLDAGAAYVGVNQLHDFGPQTTETISQELRIASPGGQFLDYVAGLYWSSTDAERYFRRDTVVCTASTLPADATGLLPCTPAASTIVTPSADALFGADFKNFAAFADGTWNLSDDWRLITGARWTQDKLSFVHNYNFSPLPGPGIRTQPGGGAAPTLSGSNTSDNLSGRAGVQWDVTDRVMTYATYARGYKGPAYNVFFNMGPNNTRLIEAETVNSFEIGAKSTLLGGTLVLNAAAFSARYDDFQANNFLFLNGTLITTLTNAGEVKTEGFELDFIARPMDGLSLSGGFAYTDAVVDRFPVPASAPPGTQPTVRSGSKLPLAPEWKASLAGEYRIRLPALDLVPGVLIAYQDEQFSDLNEPAALRIPGYSTIDLSLAFVDKQDRYRVTLVGRNVTDESYAALLTGGGPGGAPRYQVPRDADRYFGIQARFNFNR